MTPFGGKEHIYYYRKSRDSDTIWEAISSKYGLECCEILKSFVNLEIGRRKNVEAFSNFQTSTFSFFHDKGVLWPQIYVINIKFCGTFEKK